MEEIESRLYSQVFHSTEDWESDSVTPNMILNDMSNRHVSNYAVNNFTHSNANRYWCGQNSVMIPSPTVQHAAVPYTRVPNKKIFDDKDREEQIRRMNKELKIKLRRQKKRNKRKEMKLAKKINSILVNNSATVDNDQCFDDTNAQYSENSLNTSHNSGMFADDSIIYQHISVPSFIYQPSTENLAYDDGQLPVMQQQVSSTSIVVDDRESDVIVLSDDSDSDSVMEVLLPPAPIYTIDSSTDSDSSVSSSKSKPITMQSAASDVNVSGENSLLGSSENKIETSDDKNVIVKAPDEVNTSSILVENASDNKELLVSREQDDMEMKDDTSVVDEIQKPKEIAYTSDTVAITEEERTALLYSPDSNTNDFIANDVDNMNKRACGFNFMLHGSDLDLSNKDPEKLNRGVPCTDIYETESSCSEAGALISKAPVFHEIDFESPTKEIFCEPNLASFSEFITPVRKTKSLEPTKSSPRRVKTKALSLIERNSEKTTKDVAVNDDVANNTQEKPFYDTDEYNSDATTLHVKKKSKKKKKKNKKNKDKLNSEADREMIEEDNVNSEREVNVESRKSNNKNETDNKIAESEKTKKLSNKNTNDGKSSDKEKNKKSSNKSEDDDKQEKNETNKNKKQLKTSIRDLTVSIENSEVIVPQEDVSADTEKSNSSDKNKNKRPKKASSRDMAGDSLNSDMNIVTITEQQTTSQLPSKTCNEFSFVETMNKIENKSKEDNTEAKVEIREEHITMENTDTEKETLIMESSSGDNGGLKRFSFVGTWNKLNPQSTEITIENPENIGTELNNTAEQNKSTEFNKSTDQDSSTSSNRNKGIEPLSEYISLNMSKDTEKPTDNSESSKTPKETETKNNSIDLASANHSSYVPITLINNDSKSRNKNTQDSPDENPGSSSSSKKLRKSEKAADVIVLSSDSNSDVEFSPRFKFYKDPDKDIPENFVLNSSSEFDRSFDLDAAGTSNSDARISKHNLVVNPFSVGKMKKSFKDYWTPDMGMLYDESWGQENYDIQQVWSSMPCKYLSKTLPSEKLTYARVLSRGLT